MAAIYELPAMLWRQCITTRFYGLKTGTQKLAEKADSRESDRISKAAKPPFIFLLDLL